MNNDRNKESLHITVPSGLKATAEDKMKYNKITFSGLMEEKLREFTDEEANPDIEYEDISEYVCECGAILNDKHLDKTDDKCPNCDREIERS